MDTDQSGSSKDTEKGQNENSNASEILPKPIDYAATGARPKVFPPPTSSTIHPVVPPRQSRVQPFGTALRQSSKDDSDDEESPSQSNYPRAKRVEANAKYGLTGGTWGQINDELGNEGEERSTVEITMVDQEENDDDGVPLLADLKIENFQKTQEQLDEEYARSLAFQDVNEGFNSTETGGFNLEEAGDVGGGFSSHEVAGAGVGFDSVDKGGFQFPDNRISEETLEGTSKETSGRVKCAYCGRVYNWDFLQSHQAQCIENPAVIEERRATKLAVEDSMLSEWRSRPNPPTQANWPTVISEGFAAEHVSGQTQNSPVSWSTDVAAGGGQTAAASQFGGFYSNYDVYSDETMIPCEFCGELLPVYAIQQHQNNCEVRN